MQDSDSLKIYVTYVNKSKTQAMTGDSLSKIVANGAQFEYNHDLISQDIMTKMCLRLPILLNQA